MNRKKALALVATTALAACASAPKPTQDRGWIGGRFADVARACRYDAARTWNENVDKVVGMPAEAPGDAAALVTAAYPGSPAAAAGLAPGDLVLAIDGAPVADALDLRERVEALSPGSHTILSCWRAGETRTVEVVVGRETFESAGTVTIAVPLSLRLDLWPFDDGISVLNLVQVYWDHRRNDLDGPVNEYRREVSPDREAESPQQESFGMFVVPFGFTKGKRVVKQETLP